jgi:hypothetical protein
VLRQLQDAAYASLPQFAQDGSVLGRQVGQELDHQSPKNIVTQRLEEKSATARAHGCRDERGSVGKQDEQTVGVWFLE